MQACQRVQEKKRTHVLLKKNAFWQKKRTKKEQYEKKEQKKNVFLLRVLKNMRVLPQLSSSIGCQGDHTFFHSHFSRLTVFSMTFHVIFHDFLGYETTVYTLV